MWFVREHFDKPLAKKSRGASHQVVCNEKKLAVVKWYDKTATRLINN